MKKQPAPDASAHTPLTDGHSRRAGCFSPPNGYTCRASANPNNVNAIPPAMCNSNTAAASAYRAASSFSATSAEKAENVVKLPKNPVTKSSLHIWFGDKPSTAPAKKQPSQLAASVPRVATCP